MGIWPILQINMDVHLFSIVPAHLYLSAIVPQSSGHKVYPICICHNLISDLS